MPSSIESQYGPMLCNGFGLKKNIFVVVEYITLL